MPGEGDHTGVSTAGTLVADLPHLEPGSPVVGADEASSPATGRQLVPTAVLGFVATAAICLGALLGGQAFETHLPGAWFFGMPGGLFGSMGSYDSHPPVYAIIAVYGGLILLTRVWLGFLAHVSAHPGLPVRRILLVVVVWSLPLLAAPPLFSRDVYSYAGQGEMVSHNINPYDYGTGVLGYTGFSTMPDTVWTNTPSPYGPTFLGLDAAADKISGHKILPDLLLLRLLELVGLALVAAATPTLARRRGRDPAHALLLGLGCPLVLTTLIGGAHNEALMLGLLLAGLAVAQRWGTVPGIILCAAAAGVKSPAAVGIVFLGWMWAGPGASWRRRVGHTAAALAIGLVTLEAITAASGTGWGWLHTFGAANQSFTGVTPIDAISKVLAGIGYVLHLHFSQYGARTVLTVAGLVIAGVVGLLLLVRTSAETMQRDIGVTLLVVAVLGPILWGWYASWGILVLAPIVTGQLRRIIIGFSIFEAFVGVSSVKNLAGAVWSAGILPDLILVAAIAAIVIVPLVQFGGLHLPHRGLKPLRRPVVELRT
jgi:hypothetical protein